MIRSAAWKTMALLLPGLLLICGCTGCVPGTAATDPAFTVGDGPGWSGAAEVRVVAVENQYGSLVAQLGGKGVRYRSVITNPDSDPHEFQTNFAVVRAYQAADLVVENGLGYDDFSDKIMETLTHKPVVVNAGDVLGLKAGDNPHVWYSPDAVDRLCQAITEALKKVRPAGSAYFDARAKEFADKLAPYHEAVSRIRQRFAGIPVGATESIFVPMAQATGLNLISPPGLMNAVAEDAAPSVKDLARFKQQIQEKQIKVLVYNNQTSGTLTLLLRNMAEQAGIPVVGVSETLAPADATFESWQIAQLKALEHALASSTGH